MLVEDSNGRVESETRQYRTYGAELDLLVEWLSGLDLARTVMESTGVFWKSVQRALAVAGVEVWVVNARHVKRVPGRKTDVSDSQWLATLARYGLVSPSFLAPPKLEELRRLTRLYARTRRLASMLRNMLHRMLDESGLRIGGILTDLFGLSGRNLLDGLLKGHEPEQMVAGVKGKARKKVPALLDALGQGLDEGAKPLVGLLREMLDARSSVRSRSWSVAFWTWSNGTTSCRGRCCRPCRGPARWPRPRCWPKWVTTWRRSAPRDGCRAGRGCARATTSRLARARAGSGRKGNVYLRRILCEVAHAAARTRGVQFGPYKQGLAIRRGTGRAVVATAHKILRIAFAMLRDGQPYRDPQVDYQARTAIRNKARWLKMLRKANLLQEVARAAAKQSGGGRDGTHAGPGLPPSGGASEAALA